MKSSLKSLLTGAILTGILAGNIAKATDNTAPAPAGDQPAAESKDHCGSKEHCGKDGCGGKDTCGGKEKKAEKKAGAKKAKKAEKTN
jgi:hypothetical protein